VWYKIITHVYQPYVERHLGQLSKYLAASGGIYIVSKLFWRKYFAERPYDLMRAIPYVKGQSEIVPIKGSSLN
jgi:drug/metabolite transporter superfamily protein YnfA